jgi:UDP-N-acetylmuramoyl-L-alanyl-D-glutamate--2,6-diaminopimelate ligase
VTLQARPHHVVPVALSTLAELAKAECPHPDIEVTGVSLRTGVVRSGDLYAALPGANTHGARFAEVARAAGACAILTDPEGVVLARAASLPLLVVDNPRAVLGQVAAAVYGSPATALTLIGVTGTQGKTTTTQLLAGGLAAAGRRTAVIGTMGTWVNGQRVESPLTTPEAPDLHALFAVMREQDVEVCAMEVSSHALVLGRVDAVRFDVSVFLNFGRDHLDFHHDVESYFAAKAELFTPRRARRALLNVDDASVASLRETVAVPVRTFSPSGHDADWRCSDVVLRTDGSDFRLTGPEVRGYPVSIRLAGDYNVANAAAALAAVGEAGLDVATAADGLAQVETVAGRLERIETGRAFAVVVDYAHKPDAVRSALRTLRGVTTGRLLVVLGAGGDRDPGKRELMGAAAAELADVLVVTDDNPRSEEPGQIRAALVAGAGRGRAEVYEIGDRRAAIERAVSLARAGDTVLVAGKGHETGQEVAGQVLPFDDRTVVREILGSLAGSASPS